MEKKWAELTPEEKREERFKQWLEAPGVKFSSQEAEQAYKERTKRVQDVLLMKEPDRVPVSLGGGNYAIYYGGSTLYKAMYDYEELCRAWRKFFYDFSEYTDIFGGPFAYNAKVFEKLGLKVYAWPGGGLSTNVSQYQFVEREYMKADEYDDFLLDPSDFALRVVIPRTMTALEPLKNLIPFSSMMGIGGAIDFVSIGANPDIRNAFQAIFDAGTELVKSGEILRALAMEIQAAGFPSIRSVFTLAPFDSVADILRGTSGASKDMYEQPDKMLEAIDKTSDMIIKQTIANANALGVVAIAIPLHKGDDTFLSDKHYETFYWPTLKKLILAFRDEGLITMAVAEGRYERRLEVIQDVPKTWTHWTFDLTDMFRAKRIVGKNASISGIFPHSLLLTGTAQDVEEYCRKLIEGCGVDGGFILHGGAVDTNPDPEKLRVFMKAAKEYGVYK